MFQSVLMISRSASSSFNRMLNGFKLSPPEVAIAKSQPNYKFQNKIIVHSTEERLFEW